MVESTVTTARPARARRDGIEGAVLTVWAVQKIVILEDVEKLDDDTQKGNCYLHYICLH